MSTAVMSHAGAELSMLELTLITSKRNVRQHSGKAEAFDELVRSIQEHGVLEPIIVRPEVGGFEIVAGHRRFAAAKKAGYSEIPAMVRQLTDQQALEIQLLENLHRSDLHPLEEAEGYRQLVAVAKYDVARIAERIGRSAKYVYDRMKLLSLTKENQELFLEGKITAGHAILLARLKPSAQKRAVDQDKGGLWEPENTLFHPEKDEEEEAVKPRSVRELQGWIDEHVRFDPDSEDLPNLFPETHQQIEASREKALKIVSITHEHFVQPEAKDGDRIIGPRSWKRAPYEECEHVVMGVIAAGPGRGEAFPICIDKKKCSIHWGKEQREAAKRAKANLGDKRADRQKKDRERWEEQQARDQARADQWQKALPAIREAIAGKVKSSPANTSGLLAKILIAKVKPWGGASSAAKLVPLGKTAEDLVRHAAFLAIDQRAQYAYGDTEYHKTAKALGVDLKKILAGYAPAPVSDNAGQPKKKPAGVKRTKAKKARV